MRILTPMVLKASALIESFNEENHSCVKFHTQDVNVSALFTTSFTPRV